MVRSSASLPTSHVAVETEDLDEPKTYSATGQGVSYVALYWGYRGPPPSEMYASDAGKAATVKALVDALEKIAAQIKADRGAPGAESNL